MTTYTIPEITKDTLSIKVSKWNKKAIKIGFEPIVLIFGTPYSSDKFTPKPVSVLDVEIVGEIPHYNGWEFVSKVDHTLGKAIFSTAPHQDVPDHYFAECPSDCDHCNSKRTRNTTYIIVKGEDYKNVGSTCIKDFFQDDIEKHVSKLFNIFDEIYELASDPEQFASAPQVYDVLSILEYSFELILKDGFVSKAASTEEIQPTSTWVDLWLLTGKKEFEIKPSDKSKALAKDALEWIKNGLTGDNEFVYNLKTFVEIGFITAKYIAFIAAGANSYFKKITAFVPYSEWVGVEKEKIELNVTIIGKKSWPNNYGGWTTLIRFKDDDDRVLVWFASNAPESFVVDSIHTIKGTIKKLDQYQGNKQTILTRVKEIN